MNQDLTFQKLQQTDDPELRHKLILEIGHEESIALDCPYLEAREFAIDLALKQGRLKRRPRPGEYICRMKKGV